MITTMNTEERKTWFLWFGGREGSAASGQMIRRHLSSTVRVVTPSRIMLAENGLERGKTDRAFCRDD
jgi:hypothetical protein